MRNTQDPVAAQYEQWVYPLPIPDLRSPDQKDLRDLGDPCFLGHAYWPSSHREENLDILVAGCGANAAARYALNHPTSQVTGIDISSASLAHESHLKDKHKLVNLTLRQCRIEDVSSLGQDFDFIDASTVLHHLPQPGAGLGALRQVLRPDGVIFLAVYGKYGRTGVYMYQQLFRLLGLGQSERDVEVVKQAVGALGNEHFLKHYIDTAPDLHFDSGWVDTFLHKQDLAFTVADCLSFLEHAGLAFQGWMENAHYYPDAQIPRDHPFVKHLNALGEPQLWQAMELINGRLSMHCFFACLPGRDPSSYKITFDSDEFLEYFPVWRVTKVNARGSGLVISRPPFREFELNADQAALFRMIDGKKTARQCLEGSGIAGPMAERVEFARNFFRSMWRIGYVFMRRAP